MSNYTSRIAMQCVRRNDLKVTITDTEPVVIFLHYYGTGPAESLAKAVRAAIDQLGQRPATH